MAYQEGGGYTRTQSRFRSSRAPERILSRAKDAVKELNEDAVHEAQSLIGAVKELEIKVEESWMLTKEGEASVLKNKLESARLKAAGFLRANEKRIRSVENNEWDEWMEMFRSTIEDLDPVLTRAEEQYSAYLEEKKERMGKGERFDVKKERQLGLLVDAMVGLGNNARLATPEVAASGERREKGPLDSQEALRFLRSSLMRDAA